MQTSLVNFLTVSYIEQSYCREDENNDSVFYKTERLQSQLDEVARNEIEKLYHMLLQHGYRILDLMSSRQSHFPGSLESSRVTGLGMNMKEMEINLWLSERVVHDINQDPSLPFDDSSFDAVICSLSVEYLCRPVDIFKQIARVLVPGRILIVTFSNRWFQPKVIKLLTELHQFERTGLVLKWLLEASRFKNLHAFSLLGLPRPEGDRFRKMILFSDPVYAVWGFRD